jgi:hypothetical protein
MQIDLPHLLSISNKQTKKKKSTGARGYRKEDTVGRERARVTTAESDREIPPEIV